MSARPWLGEEFQASPGRHPCFRKSPQRQQRHSKHGVGDAKLGVEVNGRLEFGDRPDQVLLLAQGLAERGVGLGVLGVDVNGLAEFSDGLVPLPLFP